ncbi:putative short chain dehydrogenase/ reductase [Hypoxylon sp. NC1633]|nr:putative short chain dehydrogenase/ reductase [Hypoxylon sp. NC1633]
MPPIASQNVLVIGGSSGIGFAVAKLCLAEGLNVSIASSSETRVEAALRRLRDAAPSARGSLRGYVCDVNHDDAESSLEQLFADVNAALLGDADGQRQSQGEPFLDHVVYTSVILDARPLASLSAAALRDGMQFKFVVPLLLGKLAPRYVRRARASSLTFTSGQAAERPIAGTAVMSGGGAATFAIGRALAIDLAPLRVNVVSPGVIDTELLHASPEIERGVQLMTQKSLLGGIGTPDEVAEAYVYLMKDTNATASIVSSNGGGLVQ